MPRKRPLEMHVKAATGLNGVRGDTNDQCRKNFFKKCTFKSLQVRIGLEGAQMSNAAKTSIGNARTSRYWPV